MADAIYVITLNPITGCATTALVKADLLGGPWCVTPDPHGVGFNCTHVATGVTFNGAQQHDAHVARRLADAFNRLARRVRTLTDVVRQRFVLEAIAAATLEGEQV